MSEKWLPVVGYEGYYEVSDAGNVRSVDRWVNAGPGGKGRKIQPGKDLSLRTLPSGHKVASLWVNGVGTTELVHRLVLFAFVGPPLPGYVCCHGNGNPGDNSVSNLRWDTPSENNHDRYRHRGPRTECRNGHALAGDNVFHGATGSRLCRICRRARVNEWNRKRRERAAACPIA